MIPGLHSMAESNASDESDGVAKQEDEQIGIFQILDKLEEAVDALLNTSSSLSLPQMEVRTKQKPYGCPLCIKSFSSKQELKLHITLERNLKAAPNVQSHLRSQIICVNISDFILERNLIVAPNVQSHLRSYITCKYI